MANENQDATHDDAVDPRQKQPRRGIPGKGYDAGTGYGGAGNSSAYSGKSSYGGQAGSGGNRLRGAYAGEPYGRLGDEELAAFEDAPRELLECGPVGGPGSGSSADTPDPARGGAPRDRAGDARSGDARSGDARGEGGAPGIDIPHGTDEHTVPGETDAGSGGSGRGGR